jgi:hypothetical protein
LELAAAKAAQAEDATATKSAAASNSTGTSASTGTSSTSTAAKDAGTVVVPRVRPAAKAKAALTTFFARSSVVALMHFLQQTFDRSKTRKSALSLAAVQSCTMLLEDGLNMLKGLRPAALAIECRQPFWASLLSSASKQVLMLCAEASPVPEECQTLAMELSVELVRCAFSDRNLHSRMPLRFTLFAPLEVLPCVCQWHSSQVFTALTVHTVTCV